MNCQQVTQFLTDYLDNSLPWYQSWLFTLHLACCGSCRRYLATFKETIRLARMQGYPQDPSDLPAIPADLVRVILSVRPQTESHDSETLD